MMRQQHGDDGRLECIRSLSLAARESGGRAARIIVGESGGRATLPPAKRSHTAIIKLIIKMPTVQRGVGNGSVRSNLALQVGQPPSRLFLR